MTTETDTALDVARQLAAAGVPIFIAQPDPAAKTGYRPPPRWQRTQPNPGVVDLWRPGLALCAVMGCGLDLIDFDPRNGGDPSALNGSRPHVYGLAATPSGGAHAFIASLGVGSRDNVLPGIDVKGGLADGHSRGFAFLAPTVRISSATGQPAAYRWLQEPNLNWLGVQDTSGAALAARIRELRTDSDTVRGKGGPQWWQDFMDAREPQTAPAADKAVADKLAEVATWTAESGSGFRTVLLRAALTLGGYVGCEHLDEDEARARLEKAVAAVWGGPDSEDLLWIQQGLDDGAAAPFSVYTAEDERAWSDAAQAVAAEGEEPEQGPPEPPWNVFRVLGAEPFDPSGDSSDQGLAKAVANRMYPALRYARDAGLWIKRDRDVWEECGDGMSDWVVSLLAELMPLGQTPVPKKAEERTEGHWQAARRAVFMSSAGTSKISQKLRAIVRSDHPASLRISDLDTNPEVLWAGGVPWNLRASGELPTPAAGVDPSTPHLRSAMCAPNPTVATPHWDAFTAAVMPDPEVRAWAMRVLAIALTGYPDAAVPILYGRERSGKTSLVEMLVVVLGSYAHAANPKLLSSDDKSHDAIIYDLRGRRLSFIDEGPRRGHDATERLKQLTGGGSQTGRPMYGKPVTFRPTHTLVMTTNPEPQLVDPALRARVRLVPCNTAEETVRPLIKRLRDHHDRVLAAEAPGILAALMRESAAWLADRDTAAMSAAPISIRGLADEIAQGQDPIQEWVETCTVPTDPGTQTRPLYSRLFAQWHQEHPRFRRMMLPTETYFGRRLTELGYPAKKVNGLMYRPLSVLNGGYGAMPQPPTPTAYMAPSGAASGGLGRVSGRVEEGLEPQPSLDETLRSHPVLVEPQEGSEGFSLLKDEEVKSKENKKAREKIGEVPSTLPVFPSNGRSTSANTPGGSVPGDPPTTLPEVPAGSRTAMRKARQAEERAAKIADAAGERIPLPAAVNRAQEIAPLTIERAAAVVRAAAARTGALTVDVETSGYPVGHADYTLQTVQLGGADMEVTFAPDDPAQAALIAELLAEAPKLHAHSATADLVPLAYAGLCDESAWERMHDTVIPAKLADPASTGSDPGLKKLSPAVLGESAVIPAADAGRDALFKAGRWLKDLKVDTPLERSGWAQAPRDCATMIRYGASDVLDTAALAARLPSVPAPVLERERAVQRITARVAHRGVRIDGDQVRRLTTEHTADRGRAAELVRAFGVDNPGSDQQVADKLTEMGAPLPRTPGGRSSVAAAALAPLKQAPGQVGDLVRATLDFRHHDTVLGTFLTPYRELVERGDGRARPTVYTLGTDTGRMSCVRPNLQQLPRKGGVRACMTADPGYLLISADFRSVEVRVMAALSQDPDLIRILHEGADLHAMVAAQAFGPDFTKEDRSFAKRGVFGWAYGGGIPSLAKQLGISEGAMAAIVESLRLIAPTYVRWADELKRAVRAGRTQLATYAGRVIHLAKDQPHKGPNFAVQGTARELLVDAGLAFDETEHGRGATVIPVHDEILAFVRAEAAEQATADLLRCMTTSLYGVPITAEADAPSFAWQDAV